MSKTRSGEIETINEGIKEPHWGYIHRHNHRSPREAAKAESVLFQKCVAYLILLQVRDKTILPKEFSHGL